MSKTHCAAIKKKVKNLKYLIENNITVIIYFVKILTHLRNLLKTNNNNNNSVLEHFP